VNGINIIAILNIKVAVFISWIVESINSGILSFEIFKKFSPSRNFAMLTSDKSILWLKSFTGHLVIFARGDSSRNRER
jgi:hypothetical protein